jgi:hypothetical protein
LDISNFARKANLQTRENLFLNISIYGTNGKKIQHEQRLQEYRFGTAADDQVSPYRAMLASAKDWWIQRTQQWNGSENTLDVMELFGYSERDELDTFFRWLLMDYEYTVSDDLALMNWESPQAEKQYFATRQTMVVDPRGYETVLQQFAAEHNIVPTFETRESNIFAVPRPVDLLFEVAKINFS